MMSAPTDTPNSSPALPALTDAVSRGSQSPERPVRILQLTDLHVFKEPNTRLKGIPTRESLADVIEHVNRSDLAIDHVIVTGDHTHDELPESYVAVAELLSPWRNRLWSVPGNHDDRALLRSAFFDRIAGEGAEQVRFRFETGSWLCLGVDTHLPGAVSGLIEPDQVDWVAAEIERSPAASVALFMHHPPVDVGSVWMDAIGLSGREHLIELVKSEERIRLICCGHVHHEFETRVGAARIATTPSTGVQFDPAGTTPSVACDLPGYRLLEFSGDAFATRVVRLPELRFNPSPD